MEWTQEKLNELYFKMQKKAMTDEEYRKGLLSNPNKMIEEEIGGKLPEGFQVNVIESDPAYTATFVLPDMMGDELEDDELDQVAGGVVSVLVIISACAAAISPGGCAADACAAKATATK